MSAATTHKDLPGPACNAASTRRLILESLNSMFKRLLPQMLLSDQAKHIVRAVLFVCVGLVLCPVQYWALTPNDEDNTWLFALNYAAAHHLVMGRDIAWTSGPLAYLAAPMDIGNNLVQGLAFQAALWTLLLAILWGLFFRGGFSLKNLAFFSVFLGLSSSLYQQRTPGKTDRERGVQRQMTLWSAVRGHHTSASCPRETRPRT
jgi:hypothetical protein